MLAHEMCFHNFETKKVIFFQQQQPEEKTIKKISANY